MNKFFPAACWAIAMLVLALLARIGWADRDAVLTLLLVMPILAVTAMRRGTCCRPAREA